MSLMGHRTR